MKNIQLFLVILFLISGISCVMTPKQPALHDFGLARSERDKSSASIKTNIAVDAPTWLWDNRIRYRLLYASPTHVGFYALDQWIASPPELLQQNFLSTLKIKNKTLSIQLLEFEQQFDSPDHARVVLRFIAEAFSFDTKRKLGTHEFILKQPCDSPNADGAIKGLSRLVQNADEQLRSWLVSLAD